jgi:hypothetical protein
MPGGSGPAGRRECATEGIENVAQKNFEKIANKFAKTS